MRNWSYFPRSSTVVTPSFPTSSLENLGTVRRKLFRCVTRDGFIGAVFLRICFDSAHNTQQVTAQDCLDLVVGVTAVDESLSNVRIAARIFELRGEQAYAIEIGADADVFSPRDLGDMVDMIEQVVNRTASVLVSGFPTFQLRIVKGFVAVIFFLQLALHVHLFQ